MSSLRQIVVIALVSWYFAAADGTPKPMPQQTVSPLPAYQAQDNPVTGYVPHATYPYADTYGPNPAHGFDGYLITPADVQGQGGYMSSLVPTFKGVLQAVLRVLGKVSLFLVGGIALLVVGGLFTTAVCSITPFCTITFNGFGKLSKETVRGYMTPENMAQAAAFVEDAVNKYQRLQRGIQNGKLV